ncbi:hypothetical protein THUN1379_26580 [Paludibacterium sp. THUN1379]|uniref:nuclear transport factor 2 family protein n=1 Tax=Paludibacterium sp. THUN1379 TaxID=3112107 RepID=UPI0030899C20|nr:hypothetical protein THUN1379_26580 [Paludibacterium sp. THUN1379]
MTNETSAGWCIQQQLNRFANCFDLKSWDEMAECLAETLYTDYSDLRGTPPETLSRERYIALRREALDGLKTHHLYANHEITLNQTGATARVSALIQRLSPDGQVLDTHCVYLFELDQHGTNWVIRAITQKVLWTQGNPAIHAGIGRQDPSRQTTS